MVKNINNNVASVHQRLLNKSRESSRPFNELLQYFAIERFMYRLSMSPHADRFLLKGALMFSVWSGAQSRPTRDIDFLGIMDNNPDVITAAMKDACEMDVEEDGMSYNGDTITATGITEDVFYKGVRVKIQGNLGNARVLIQIDIGFGDPVFPEPMKVVFPSILDFPSPVLNGYTMESTVAEKFHAMVKLGILNSRMKDFYDIWLLSHKFDFKGDLLAEAIKKTFEKRNTSIEIIPTVFSSSFIEDQSKINQWHGFIEKARLDDAPKDIEDVVTAIRVFLRPLLVGLVEGKAFSGVWTAPGPWQSHPPHPTASGSISS